MKIQNLKCSFSWNQTYWFLILFIFLVVRYANSKSSFSFSDGSFFIAPYCVFLFVCLFYTVSPPNCLRILIVVILKFPLLCIYLFPLKSFDVFIFSLLFILKVFLKWLLVIDNHWLIVKKEAIKNRLVGPGPGGSPLVEHRTARAGGEVPPQDDQAATGHVSVWKSSLSGASSVLSMVLILAWPLRMWLQDRTWELGHLLWVRPLFIPLLTSAMCTCPPFPVSDPASPICGSNSVGEECQLYSPQHSPFSVDPSPSVAGDSLKFCE